MLDKGGTQNKFKSYPKKSWKKNQDKIKTEQKMINPRGDSLGESLLILS